MPTFTDTCKKIIPLFCSLLLATNALGAGIESDRGWWVVLGAFADPDLSDPQEASTTKLRAEVARCGFDAFNDFSNKFLGFAPGYDVVVLGAFPRKSKAQAILRAVRPCAPAAYIKFGRHLGE